jgi:hypothetical protein
VLSKKGAINMRKFIFSIVSIVNMILLGIAFGLGSNSAANVSDSEKAIGNYYQLVFRGPSGANPAALNIVAFCLFVAGAAIVVFALIPFKFRKFVNILGGLVLIGGGVLTLFVPTNYMEASADHISKFASTGSLIAMSVLMIVAGALALGAAIIELLPKKEAK